MKAHELRTKSDEELEAAILSLARKRFNLRMQQGTGQLSRPSEIKSLRRDLARVKTVINERRIERAGR
jgi:large subunit ribosomal protein L29